MNIKPNFSILFVLLTSFVFGQNTSDSLKEVIKPSKNYVGLFFSIAQVNPNDNFYHQDINYRPGFSFEHLFNKKISKDQ